MRVPASRWRTVGLRAAWTAGLLQLVRGQRDGLRGLALIKFARQRSAAGTIFRSAHCTRVVTDRRTSPTRTLHIGAGFRNRWTGALEIAYDNSGLAGRLHQTAYQLACPPRHVFF